ncbi:MAG: PAS domain S-box protein [Actinomycetota bacterium]|nr:PAS domain S-box protein [Actinomycetota bacterium]
MLAYKETLTSDITRVALEWLPSPVFVHDVDTLFYANLAAQELFGASDRSHLEGLAIESIVHPHDRDAGAQRRTLVLQHDHVYERVPLKLLTLQGEPLYLEVSARRIFVGGVPLILAVGRWGS